MSITQNIDGFTTTPQRTSPATFSADTDTYHVELSTFITQIGTWTTQVNATASTVNSQASQVNTDKVTVSGYVQDTLGYKNLSQTYSNEALSYKTGAELAYLNTQNLVNNLVIPTSATYTYAEIDDSFTSELDTFLNFKI